MTGEPPSLSDALAAARVAVAGRRAAILVEGLSDQRALETLSRRRGRDLAADGVALVPMGGSKSVGHFLDLLGPGGRDLRLAGLCDVAEEGDFLRALERAGMGVDLTRRDMASLGFHVCVEDLEDELIRALGVDAVMRVIALHGESGSLRTFQRQPAQRDRPVDRQLRRFLGTQSGRKIRYAGLLVEALDLAHVPRPLDDVLAAV